MGFDLVVWPLDEPLDAEAAARVVADLVDDDPWGPPLDLRLAQFVDEVRGDHPWLTGDTEPVAGETLFELDTHARHVFVGIGWGDIELIGSEIADAAWRHGLAVFDPQRGVVALPGDLGGSPMTWEGLEPYLPVFDGWVKPVGEVIDQGPDRTG